MKNQLKLTPHAMVKTLEQAFEHLGINFFAIDRTGRYRYYNTSLRHYIKRDRRADKIDSHAWADCQAVMANKTPKIIEETYRDTTFLSVKAPILNADKDALGVVGIAIDISERKQAEKALAVAKQAAETANQAKTHFLENISHDLRTPLTNILALAEQLLMAQPQDSQYTAQVAALLSVGQSLLQSFNEILDYTACSDKSLIQQGHVHLKPFCQSTLQLFQIAADQVNTTLN